MFNVIRCPIKPCGLDDFQTMWLCEFLILCLWQVDWWSNLKIIDYVASPIHKQ